MRKVFLDELPRWEKGGNKGKIKWTECSSYKVKFVYDDMEGEIEIVDYDKNKQDLFIMYRGKSFKIKTYEFAQANISRIVGKRTEKFKIEIGTRLKDNKRDLVILDREYREYKKKPNQDGKIYVQKLKYYKYKCNVCGYNEGWTTETLLLNRKDGCACCRSLVVVPEINSIWTTDHWMVDLGVSEEDAKRYTRGSYKKIEVICPDCGNKKMMEIDSIRSYKSINCICRKTSSYPEKFMTSILNQLELDFKTQLSRVDFGWCEDYKYDFYILSLNMIIETHGKQHYTSDFSRAGGRTLEEEQENDRLKKELALSNGIDEYIVIDCRYSELEWIKNSVLNSKLNELFDLSKIDWLECEKFALRNIIKEVCEYWNTKEDWETTSNLAEVFQISPGTVAKYLKKGNELGWTTYNPKDEVFRIAKLNGRKSRERNSIPIEVFKDGVSMGVFNSITDLSEMSEEKLGIKLNRSCIGDVVNEKRKYHKGFTFKRIEDIA